MSSLHGRLGFGDDEAEDWIRPNKVEIKTSHRQGECHTNEDARSRFVDWIPRHLIEDFRHDVHDTDLE